LNEADRETLLATARAAVASSVTDSST
jgi:hypothetical protein